MENGIFGRLFLQHDRNNGTDTCRKSGYMGTWCCNQKEISLFQIYISVEIADSAINHVVYYQPDNSCDNVQKESGFYKDQR